MPLSMKIFLCGIGFDFSKVFNLNHQMQLSCSILPIDLERYFFYFSEMHIHTNISKHISLTSGITTAYVFTLSFLGKSIHTYVYIAVYIFICIFSLGHEASI